MDFVVRGANALITGPGGTLNLWQVLDELEVPDLKRART